MQITRHRKAFSMIEVVFVITILGIITSIGSEVIANVYENYIVQRAQHRASIKTQLALNQIANRLRHTIPGSIGRRVGRLGGFELSTSTMASAANTYTVLQWVGTDVDSFEAIQSDTNRQPGWSGFCDVDNSTATVLSTPGSNLGLTNTIIDNLSNGTRDITTASLFFPNDLNGFAIQAAVGNTITLAANPSNRIVERYKLAWTSYALSVEGGDLFLYSNFAPTIGAAIVGANRSLLLKNVTNFKFENRGSTTRIKLCVNENIGDGFSIPSCKEKAIF
jgi:prepilin-type N-terminal cleavage/methylation domain-containing protein